MEEFEKKEELLWIAKKQFLPKIRFELIATPLAWDKYSEFLELRWSKQADVLVSPVPTSKPSWP